jgi:hypothetical protein
MPLNNDWYIEPDGSSINIGAGEHASFAAAKLLGLPTGQQVPLHMFLRPPLHPSLAAIAKRNKVPAAVVKRVTGDARKAAAELYNWVRVARAKGGSWGMDVWVFDDSTLDMIRRSQMLVAEKPNLSPDDIVWINELSTNDYFELPFKRLMRRDADPEALKNLAHGVGKFRNPPPENPYIIR